VPIQDLNDGGYASLTGLKVDVINGWGHGLGLLIAAKIRRRGQV
jgi:hypothetical protein